MVECLASDRVGNLLLHFERAPESSLDTLDQAIPLPLSLVALWHGNRCLTVFDRWKQSWELPGGTREGTETPRHAAWRELYEETGQRPDQITYVGLGTIRFAIDSRLEYVALFTGRIESPVPFVPNDEIAKVRWWNPREELPGMAGIDAYLTRLSLPG
jgi:8-oxo-dGTP diphosphatase